MMEVIISLTLVATIMLVSLSASANMMRNRTSATRAVDGQQLAGYFLDEISPLAFRDPVDEPVFGPESGEISSDRRTYDDVDDYSGYRTATPTFRDGQVIPGYEGWTVQVAIYPLTIAGTTLRNSPESTSRFRLIGVSVTDPDGRASTYRTLVSITPTDLAVTQSYERLRRIELSFPENRNVDVVVPLRNTPAPAY